MVHGRPRGDYCRGIERAMLIAILDPFSKVQRNKCQVEHGFACLRGQREQVTDPCYGRAFDWLILEHSNPM